ncbi:MAG: hypothetical protein QE487_15070 [Fluviicola sp.]|nr:hypothetical protein [Fluviicola sp.]
MKVCAIFLVLYGLLAACTETHDAKKPTQEKQTIQQSEKEKEIADPIEAITKLQPNELTGSEIKKREQDIELLNRTKKLTKYRYPPMSRCGGTLEGYYSGNELILINSAFGGELGSETSQKIYWQNHQPIKILYQENWVDMEKYNKKYPNENEFDETKMMYTDTLYSIELGKTWKFRKSAGQKTISTVIDSSLVNYLINCAFSMKEELETNKKIVK